MYIGPQGIVHGTAITVMNAFRKVLKKDEIPAGKIFLTAGLGGMSGAQPKAGNIAGCITICAEVNEAAARKRHQQGWVDELIETYRRYRSTGFSNQESNPKQSGYFLGFYWKCS